MAPRYTRLRFEPRRAPLPAPRPEPEGRLSDHDVFEATRGCIHNCDFCVVPRLGIEALPEAGRGVVADIRGHVRGGSFHRLT